MLELLAYILQNMTGQINEQDIDVEDIMFSYAAYFVDKDEYEISDSERELVITRAMDENYTIEISMFNVIPRISLTTYLTKDREEHDYQIIFSIDLPINIEPKDMDGYFNVVYKVISELVKFVGGKL